MQTSRVRNLLPINIYAFSLSFHSSALLTIVVPAALLQLDPARHTQDLSRLAAISAIFAMILPPIIGSWSDHVRLRGGARRSFVLAGGVINTIGLVGMYDTHSLPLYTAFLFLSLLGQGGTQSGYQALWSDVVSEEDRGASAGVQGAATLLGNIAGLASAGILGGHQVVLVMAAVMMCGMLLTVWLVRESTGPKPAAASPRPRLQIQNRRNFAIVFWSQAYVAFGMTLLMTFVLYFFRDVLHVQNATSGTASVAILALAGAVISSILMGRVSDGGKRRTLVAASGLPMAIAAIGFAVLQRADLLWLFALLFGLGYGTFLSTGWALTVDTLPDPQNVARDLGVWNVASTFPTVLAPICGGWVLSAYVGSPATGYRVLFILSGLFLAAGGAVILRMKSTVKSSIWFVPIRLLAAAVVYLYLRTAYTVRVEGRLPLRRPGTLVVSNHLHDLDGMVIPAWLTLQGPWRHPVRYAASPRLFEPGFMAMRFPLLQRLLYRLNMGAFFRAIGTLPIENQPLKRPLASFGYAVQKAYGNLPLADVFQPETLQRVGAKTTDRLSSLWSQRLAKAAQRDASLLDLKEPCRTWFLHQQRQWLEEQLQALVAAVRSGDTLYIAPEGRYSLDGRVGRFRLACDLLSEASPCTYLALLSYDPLAKRKTPIYLHFIASRPGIPLALQVRAARPITVGHVLAHWLLTSDAASFTESDAIQAVESALARLPQGASLAVPNAQARHKLVMQSLRYMTRLGVLRRQGADYTLGAVRVHEMFPQVEDILAHQRNALLDILEALDALQSLEPEPAPAPLQVQP
ncbi:MFS transporter [Alicyclobacillus cycloheptanicus]|uniref:MFS family permease n=1 Tax=Alicyclobacillus cycloheptanicus TaxID=1457 RepID=A0ABT9XJ09_9BACL|nr:MFS transporter [Alicyclobacillus cycloheptanicus]MDQ0189768.1 MFS family permease [Alicyclobacillus cycloheptanicus]WDM01972.1 MFS transporter [Alicyclobacillus cycloheptanicus]